MGHPQKLPNMLVGNYIGTHINIKNQMFQFEYNHDGLILMKWLGG